MMHIAVTILVCLALAESSFAATKGEACWATIQCDDPALMCTGARCHCLSELGFSDERAKIWACNTAADCQEINAISLNGIAATNPGLAHSAHAPVCVPSSICPPIRGFTGFCDIALVA